MIISIIQPCFIPWLGYFEQMALADIFVYLDDVQYTRKDWRNNNQLKSPHGVKKISVPVGNASRQILINEALISYNHAWEDDLTRKIAEWYRKAPFYNQTMDKIQPILYRKHEKLVDLNYALNGAICDFLGIGTPVFYASKIPRNAAGDKNARVLEYCKHFKDVDILYDGHSAQNFIDVELFKTNGITPVFQEYVQRPYTQLWGEFVPYMSALDVLMNCGSGAREVLMSNPMSDALKKRNLP